MRDVLDGSLIPGPFEICCSYRAASANTAAAPPITHCTLPVAIAMPPVTLLVETVVGAELALRTTLVAVLGGVVMVD